ncbi:MAG: prolyl oligopeptidase family serine peptidase [Gemmatimonadaceae bacterium]|nr:prolyl oligopeptidase family serine peptidase [Gemmatimonadaceae bacterium]
MRTWKFSCNDVCLALRQARVAGVLTALLVLPTRSFAQSATTARVADGASVNAAGKKILSVADYARWRSIDNALISSDGKWVAYSTRLSNTLPTEAKPQVTIRNLTSGQDVVIAHASAPVFSSDARWIVYQIDSTVPAAAGRPRASAADSAPGPAPELARAPLTPPVTPKRVELRNLTTGVVQRWADMQSAVFSRTGSHLVLRRRPAGAATAAGPATAGRGGAPAASAAAKGSDVLLHHLATGRSQFLGSVGDIAFNRTGDMLAYTVDATARDGNGVFLIDLRSGRTIVLDNDARTFARLTWSDDGNTIAVLKGREVEKMRELDNLLVAFTGIRTARTDSAIVTTVLNPATSKEFPIGWVISERAPLAFSHDGARVFFGGKPQVFAPDTSRRKSTDSVADVDIWTTQDERIQSEQMIRAEADRNVTFRQAFEIASARFVKLADTTMRDLDAALEGKWAIGRDPRGYISDHKPPAADLYRVNTSTGERTLIAKGQLIGRHVFGISPDGKSFLFWKDNAIHAYTFETATTTKLGGTTAPNFVDTEYDYPGPRPAFGINGFSADGKHVIVSHQYDLWALSLDGAAAKNLTNGVGSAQEIRFRPVRTTPIDSLASRRERAGAVWDLAKPLMLAAYGEFTKKSGFYSLAAGKLTPVVYTDASFSTPVRAAAAEQYLFTRQTFVEFPDLQVAGATLVDAKKISDVNAHQREYAWGRRVLFDYATKDGKRLQGILALPDDYVTGEKRPMLVTFYEKNSQNMHRYSPPSFLTGMGASAIEAVSRGYITMMPDVHFRTGMSHSDMLEAVEAATKKVIELGYVDPKKIGVSGHSYGGEGAAYIGTQSKMFAAVGMGAGVTDLFTDFNQSWGWSYQVSGGSGANGNNYYMAGQGRWGFSPWDKPEVYRAESALTHVPNVSSPFLIMHGTADPTVSFSEGMNFYNALRYNGKSAVMLAYPGEGHGLRGLANRRDLTIRYMQYFDHYLKGAPAPQWMTTGVPYLVKETMRDPKPVGIKP